MTQGKEKKKSRAKTDKHENKKTEERGKRKSASRSDSLKVKSAEAEQKQTDLRGLPVGEEQPEEDDSYELPTDFILTVQR